MKQFTATEAIHIYVPAIARSTTRAYGVALTSPVCGRGVICWYRDRSAFLSAEEQSQLTRGSDEERSELSFADRRIFYRTGNAAVRALLGQGTK